MNIIIICLWQCHKQEQISNKQYFLYCSVLLLSNLGGKDF